MQAERRDVIKAPPLYLEDFSFWTVFSQTYCHIKVESSMGIKAVIYVLKLLSFFSVYLAIEN
jgi:hypothetical protein